MRVKFYASYTPIDGETTYYYGRMFPGESVDELVEWNSVDVPFYVKDRTLAYFIGGSELGDDGEPLAVGLGLYVTKYDYLDPGHPGAFLDMEKNTDTGYIDNPVECPKCKGHGGWNLEVNAYGPGKHFRASCGQCNGWGFVDSASTDATCEHDMREVGSAECKKRGIEHWGMCWHVYECKTCGNIKAYDSSD